MGVHPCLYCYILVSLHSQTRNFLPSDHNTIIKEHLCGKGLPSLFSLLQVNAFKQKQGILQQINLCSSSKPKKVGIRPFDTNNFTKVLQESTTILQLKVYFVYVMRKLVGHSSQQECPINLALLFFPFVCISHISGSSVSSIFPMKFHIIK